MSKITDYPSKIDFNDLDLYDVSSYDGANYESQSVTYAQLKQDILRESGLAEFADQDLANDEVYITDDILSETSNSFIKQAGTNINFIFYRVGKQINLWITGQVKFTAGITLANVEFYLPSIDHSNPLIAGKFPQLSQNSDYEGIAGSTEKGGGYTGSFSYSTAQGTTANKQNKSGHCWLTQAGVEPRLAFHAPDISATDDTINLGVHIVIPIL